MLCASHVALDVKNARWRCPLVLLRSEIGLRAGPSRGVRVEVPRLGGGSQGTASALLGKPSGVPFENEFRPRGRIASVTRRNSGVSPAPLTPGVRR
jgi:hypothetical protein